MKTRKKCAASSRQKWASRVSPRGFPFIQTGSSTDRASKDCSWLRRYRINRCRKVSSRRTCVFLQSKFELIISKFDWSFRLIIYFNFTNFKTEKARFRKSCFELLGDSAWPSIERVAWEMFTFRLFYEKNIMQSWSDIMSVGKLHFTRLATFRNLKCCRNQKYTSLSENI